MAVRKKTKKKPAEWAHEENERSVGDPDEVAALRREVKRLTRDAGRRRGGEAVIIHAVETAYAEPPDLSIPPRPTPSRKKSEEVALLHVTDTQIGKVTDSYNVGIADARLMQLADKVRTIVEVRRSAVKVDELVLLLGGDIIENENLFPGQQFEIGDRGVFDQAVRDAPAILARMIFRLLEVFPRIRVTAVSGNHGRSSPRSMGSHPRTNWDRVAYEVTKLMVLGPAGARPELDGRLTFEIADQFYSVPRVFDWGLLVIHGDQIRGGFGGFPWYGVGKKAWGWADSIPEAWDFLYFGHFHQHACATLNYRTFFATGTPESGNVYAQEQLAAGGWPSQRLQFLNAEHGVIADHQVFLTATGERVPQSRRRAV